MKLKTSVAAVILAFSATGAWAGPTSTGNAKSDLGNPDSTAVQPSAGPVNEELQWKFVNGTGAQDSEKGRDSQAAAPTDQGSEQSAKSEEHDSDQAAKSEQQDSDAQAAAPASESDSGQTAASEEQGGDEQSAQSESGDSDEQSAMTDEEDEGSDQAANEDEGGDQSASAEEQQGDEEQSANSDQPAADLKDKVVVIIPKDWKGSIPALISALESSPDAKDIVVVQQGDPQASNDEPDDSYSASNKPVINQQ